MTRGGIERGTQVSRTVVVRLARRVFTVAKVLDQSDHTQFADVVANFPFDLPIGQTVCE